MLNMDVPNTSVIFCQSAICVGATLVCYEIEKQKKNDVIIVVRNVETIFRFLKTLKLEAEVFWLDKYSIKKSYIFNQSDIIRHIQEDFNRLNITRQKISHVYFTSVCNDLLMGCYLNHFDRDIIVKLQTDVDIKNHLDDYIIPQVKVSFRMKLLKLFYSLVLRYKIRIQYVGTPVFAIDIGYYRYPLLDGSSQEIFKKYLYKPSLSDEKNALVFASECAQEVFGDREKYVAVFVECVKSLQEKGYHVYVKGHPRLGVLKEALCLSSEEIPSFIPSEFIDYKSFSCAYGLIRIVYFHYRDCQMM